MHVMTEECVLPAQIISTVVLMISQDARCEPSVCAHYN